MSLLEKIKSHSIVGSIGAASRLVKRKGGVIYWRWRYKDAPKYFNPTPAELETIESDLISLGVTINDYYPPPPHSRHFNPRIGFRLIIMAA